MAAKKYTKMPSPQEKLPCGNKEIVEEIMEEFPQALEHVNKKGRNILHVAIKYSNLGILEMVTKEGNNSKDAQNED